jgi:hypothetical protein
MHTMPENICTALAKGLSPVSLEGPQNVPAVCTLLPKM